MEESSNGARGSESSSTYYDESVPRLSLSLHMTTILEEARGLESSRYHGFSERSVATSLGDDRGRNSILPNGHENQQAENELDNEHENELGNDNDNDTDNDNDQEDALTAQVDSNVVVNGFQAYPHNIVDATGVTIVQEDTDAKKRRYALCLGSSLCLAVALAIILPISIVPSQRNAPVLVLATLQPSMAPSAVPTTTPTATPISPALQETLSWLQPLDSEADWQDTHSPHYRAARWLADYDTWQPASLQRFALVTLYFATVDRALAAAAVLGEAPLSNDDWIQCGAFSSGCASGALWLSPGVDECKWGYVSCQSLSDSNTTTTSTSAPNTVLPGDTAASKNTSATTETATSVVTQVSFQLRGNGLKGHLPPQLAFLSYLQVFSAGHNHLMGGNIMINGSSSPLHSIDVAFARLSTLRALTLHGNNYTGSLPLQVLRDNSQLELLLLAENQFRGTLPSELAALTRLGELQLPWNNMTGSIPTSLAKLNKTLRIINLAGNQLTGTLPTEIIQLTQLKTLILSNNSALSGSLDMDRLEMFSLQDFQAAYTQLNGTFPKQLFSRLTQLTSFKVEGASLRGSLPEELALWNKSLTSLWLQNNQFTGPLPTALNVLTQLQELRLEGNQFSGTISPSVCDRRGQGYQKLQVLTVDCSVACTCCDGYDEKCA